nr:neurogenic locus notch homolog protein 3-like [Penaeus vannamei]
MIVMHITRCTLCSACNIFSLISFLRIIPYVLSLMPVCLCVAPLDPGLETTPFPPAAPCTPSCGANAECQVVGGKGTCACLPGFYGRPELGCTPECITNSDCVPTRACINQRCVDPCAGSCGVQAECRVLNHNPICSCPRGYVGDPFRACHPAPEPVLPPTHVTPCHPDPCGTTHACTASGTVAYCTCLPGFFGDARVQCRPECLVSSDCPLTLSCISQKCRDPCPGTCGNNALCSVVSHNPVCACPEGYTGDPFTDCRVRPPPPVQPEADTNPCVPDPCGANAQCRVQGTVAVCECRPGTFGNPNQPSGCRYECVANADCPMDSACINRRCVDPCVGTCGLEALCDVVAHNPICSRPGSDAGGRDTVQPAAGPVRRLALRPCGGVLRRPRPLSCSCQPGYFGNPYEGCRPECTVNSDCPPSRACINNKCVNPCPGSCGLNADCRVLGHQPSCYCPPGYTGTRTRAAHRPTCRPECVLNSDCPLALACNRQKCRDPCVGVCGVNAECEVVNHNPICFCPKDLTGDPFVRCVKRKCWLWFRSLTPLCIACPNISMRAARTSSRDSRAAPKPPMSSPCSPSPAGRTPCAAASGPRRVLVSPELQGNPFVSVFPRMSSSTVPYARARGLMGDPYSACRPTPTPIQSVDKSPCSSGQCGDNTDCREVGGAAVCTCKPGLEGDPYLGCRPECVIPGTALATSPAAATGAWTRAQGPAQTMPCASDPPPASVLLPARTHRRRLLPVLQPSSTSVTASPCSPSPCLPWEVCTVQGAAALCLQCVVSNDCPAHQACVAHRCSDPCPGVCGPGAQCVVVAHSPVCRCDPGLLGDPYRRCSRPTRPVPPPPQPVPCVPSPCGTNARCQVKLDREVCECAPGYFGNPYLGCRPECVVHTDCAVRLACVRQRCVNPCPGSCSPEAECTVVNHRPVCTCPPGFTGDPLTRCRPVPQLPPTATNEASDPCDPGPCGANTQCRVTEGFPVCACLPGLVGNPYLGCRPECQRDTDCSLDRSCVGQRCVDPCPGTCGRRASCMVVMHRPQCACKEGYSGDPYSACFLFTPPPAPSPASACNPSPCGPFSECRDVGGIPRCSCAPTYVGTPPLCRPECVVNSECQANRACVSRRCVNPCTLACGVDAECRVINHNPVCSCPAQYTGDSLSICFPAPKPVAPPALPAVDPCVGSACGDNAECSVIGNYADCKCKPDYYGNPYVACKPECVVDSDCPRYLDCVRNKCIDPCPGACGINAICDVLNHQAMCNCPTGYTGSPLARCHPAQEVIRRPDALLRPECITNSECLADQACVSHKCVDPCVGVCGRHAICRVVLHAPVCSCDAGHVGDPTRAVPACVLKIPKHESHAGHFTSLRFKLSLTVPKPEPPRNPCSGDPCGPNAACREINLQRVCTCLPGFVGNRRVPPRVRGAPECPPLLACLNNRCVDPCKGTCGINAECRVINHNPICSCLGGFTGDPFVRHAAPIVDLPEPPAPPKDPCVPDPCGSNSYCRQNGDRYVCECREGYFGNPEIGCGPECVLSTDCASRLTCVRQKCVDPCPTACGNGAQCTVVNHRAVCSCPQGLQGDPYTQCVVSPIVGTTPPTPMQPTAKTRASPTPVVRTPSATRGPRRALQLPPGLLRQPVRLLPPRVHVRPRVPLLPGVREPEVHRPVPRHLRHQCRVPGGHTRPHVLLPPGYVGDPYQSCRPEPVTTPSPLDPCNPSPCGPNSECRTVGDRPVCECLSGYFGSPPDCRPECIVNSNCPVIMACVNKKCRDPCAGACGTDALCEVVNHNPVC